MCARDSSKFEKDLRFLGIRLDLPDRATLGTPLVSLRPSLDCATVASHSRAGRPTSEYRVGIAGGI